jgi:hypothetical protein
MYILKTHIGKEFDLFEGKITYNDYLKYQREIFSNNNTLIANEDENNFNKNQEIIRSVINSITIGVNTIKNNSIIKERTNNVFDHYRENNNKYYNENINTYNEIEKYVNNNNNLIINLITEYEKPSLIYNYLKNLYN